MNIAPYKNVKGCKNVYCNNVEYDRGKVKLSKYIHNYDTGEPLLVNIPHKIRYADYLPLFRYDTYSRIKESITCHNMCFSSPDKWMDPLESLFYNPNGVSVNGVTYYVACLCFTYDPIESEEASWARSGFNTVRVEYSFEDLCRELDIVQDYSFYFSVVDYSMSRTEISHLRKDIRKEFNSIDDYLNCLSLKRKAFMYENEIRLFVVSTSPFRTDKAFMITNINITSAIKSICLPPVNPLILTKKNVLNDLASVSVHIKVKQSRLYQK